MVYSLLSVGDNGFKTFYKTLCYLTKVYSRFHGGVEKLCIGR